MKLKPFIDSEGIYALVPEAAWWPFSRQRLFHVVFTRTPWYTLGFLGRAAESAVQEWDMQCQAAGVWGS